MTRSKASAGKDGGRSRQGGRVWLREQEAVGTSTPIRKEQTCVSEKNGKK